MGTNGLARDWITQPAIDAELKRYVLLAYLQRVMQHFDAARLFPHIEDLSVHTSALEDLRGEMEQLGIRLSRDLAGFDPMTGEAMKTPIEHEVDALRVIEDVIGFALPELHEALRIGSERVEEALSVVRFEPVGLLPLDLREGYLLVRERNEAHAYTYSVAVLRSVDDHGLHRSVRTSYIGPYDVSFASTYEAIKAELTRTRRDLPVPATFVFETTVPLPRIETCLPLARRMVWKAIAAAA